MTYKKLCKWCEKNFVIVTLEDSDEICSKCWNTQTGVTLLYEKLKFFRKQIRPLREKVMNLDCKDFEKYKKDKLFLNRVLNEVQMEIESIDNKINQAFLVKYS